MGTTLTNKSKGCFSLQKIQNIKDVLRGRGNLWKKGRGEDEKS